MLEKGPWQPLPRAFFSSIRPKYPAIKHNKDKSDGQAADE